MTCHLTDAQIAAAIEALQRATGWDSDDLLIDTVSEREGIPREDVRRVLVARITMQGAG